MSLFSRLSLIQAPALAANGEERSAAEEGHRGSENGAAATGITDKPQQCLKDIHAKAGVLIKTLKPGDITNFPKKGDTCTIHYEAFTEDEICKSKNPDPFDSSRSRDTVFQFRLGLGQVIEGMDAAVSKMSLGQEVEATIPYAYAYGVQGYPPVVQPRATLVFRIELIRFSSVV
mmetsp:Transcript_17777/g.38397  ORF Transcript_17777/g.38397 Transcript_17777/m.38397 type:complete len:174 (+) Transcript_17777:84-605(+)|eukprot:CAMPEP_0172298258 /NCGR_PEP_ID=MMETSP1058-20130122/998_1 /TAXON_ID=83371 /ORGANISM="Detonula confervacea, Strain CCMP 353" /LENGTH=173 /DNA_ID=CAMNT_0013007521 /DNA_START=79 /DNA_END=600 /DNA_ORIENTATION=+